MTCLEYGQVHEYEIPSWNMGRHKVITFLSMGKHKSKTYLKYGQSHEYDIPEVWEGTCMGYDIHGEREST